MAKDSAKVTDKVGVSIERTTRKGPELLSDPRCPKCGSLSRDVGEGKRGCANASCGHIFEHALVSTN